MWSCIDGHMDADAVYKLQKEKKISQLEKKHKRLLKSCFL